MIDETLTRRIEVRAHTAGQDELYAGIASSLRPDSREQVVRAAGLKVPSPAEIGRAFRDRIMPAVKDGICVRAKFCKNRSTFDSGAKVAALVAEHVGEAVAKVYGAPADVIGEGAKLVVETSASFLKEGLNTLCDCPE
jgi:hypothetical protein